MEAKLIAFELQAYFTTIYISKNQFFYFIFSGQGYDSSCFLLLLKVISESIPLKYILDPTLRTMLSLIWAWISKYSHYKMCDEIVYLFPIMNGATPSAWEWVSNFNPYIIGHVII